MRQFLDRFSYEIYQVQEVTGRVYEKVKTPLATLALTAWGVFLVVGIYDGVTYQSKDLTEVVPGSRDFAGEVIEEASMLMRIGSDSKAFSLLASNVNTFSDIYSEDDVAAMKSMLTDLTKEAEEITISQIYASEDLTEVLPIVKFTGVINSIDDDPLYGSTVTISDDGVKSMEQLEVTGLSNPVVGSQVTFYGVPEFNGVDRAMTTEAFTVGKKEEGEEDGD